jgi:hypothetical protein
MVREALAILKPLLSEADFFVDGKDLQTFVGDLPVALFFALSVCQAGRAPGRSI